MERLMVDRGVTYGELAAQTGVSAGYLNHIVHGNRPVPSDGLIESIAEALSVAPEHFLEFRLRRIERRLEANPALIDSLYKRLNGPGAAARGRPTRAAG
jgi:transcriptional regulator with XRE-family HTH domain